MDENNPLERLNYFTGAFLGTADFQTEQNYLRALSQFKNRHLHTWGVADGLTVEATPQADAVVVAPGGAIDADGHEILLAELTTVALPAAPPARLYLTIQYSETYADYTEHDGVGGFTRIVSIPKLEFSPQHTDDGSRILLAIVSCDHNGTIQQVTYGDGALARRHAGIGVGEITFDVAGSAPKALPKAVGRYDPLDESTSLAITAQQVSFAAAVEVDGRLAVGASTEPGDFTVTALSRAAAGLISSKDTTVTLTGAKFPDTIRPGDRIVVPKALGHAAQSRFVAARIDNQTITTDAPFSPPLDTVAFEIEQGNLMQVTTHAEQGVIKVTNAGAVSLGAKGSTETSDYTMAITDEGYVGIGIDNPKAALDVAGDVIAQRYFGDGAGLKNVAGLWNVSPANDKDIYYDEGNVAIGLQDPAAALEVVSKNRFDGQGTVSNKAGDKTLYGQGTKFETELVVGTVILVGDLADDLSHGISVQEKLVEAIKSDTELTLSEPFQPPLTDAIFKIKTPIANFAAENNTNDPALTVRSNNRVGINLAVPKYTLDVAGEINASGGIITSGDLTCDELKASDSVTVAGGATVIDKTGINTNALTSATATIAGGTLGAATFDKTTFTVPTLSTGKATITDQMILAGSSSQFGTPETVPTQADIHKTYTAGGTAQTDGIIIVQGNPPNIPGLLDLSYARGQTKDGGNVVLDAMAVCGHIYFKAKHNSTPLNFADPGSFTMPVRKGNAWTVSVSKQSYWNITWFPFGKGGCQVVEEEVGPLEIPEVDGKFILEMETDHIGIRKSAVEVASLVANSFPKMPDEGLIEQFEEDLEAIVLTASFAHARKLAQTVGQMANPPLSEKDVTNLRQGLRAVLNEPTPIALTGFVTAVASACLWQITATRKGQIVRALDELINKPH